MKSLKLTTNLLLILSLIFVSLMFAACQNASDEEEFEDEIHEENNQEEHEEDKEYAEHGDVEKEDAEHDEEDKEHIDEEVSMELVHDPSAFFLHNEKLIAYGSGQLGKPLEGVSINLSSRTYGEYIGVFGKGVPGWTKSVQQWNPTGEFDAPAILDGKFVFYTVYDETEGKIQDTIGVTENIGTPENPDWKDLGPIVSSYDEQLTTPRAMDPSVIFDSDGKLYLIFGSHATGIVITELDSSTKLLKQNPQLPNTLDYPERFIRIAQHMSDEGEESEIEAPYLYKNGEYYYLFTNWGGCCNGVNSTYYITIGRSKNITGPYIDKNGKDLVNGGGDIFLDAEGRYIGPGHAGISKLSDNTFVFTYHFYDGQDKGISKLAARSLSWSNDGWPVLGEHLLDQK